MAKRKKESKRPQACHKASGKSQHDRRGRLADANPLRRKTERALVPLVGMLAAMVADMAGELDQRIGFRLGIVVAGMMLAGGRRTATSWFVAGGVRDDWDRFYDFLASVGRVTKDLSAVVLGFVVRKVVAKVVQGSGGRVLAGIDDSPTARFGRHVEGAGVHHNPTPGPADGEWLYGHNWVSLAVLARHSLWGVIALPVRSLLYVRRKDVPALDEKRGWTFRTKLELAAELAAWFTTTLSGLGVALPVWFVVDGAYVAKPFLHRAFEVGAVVVGRLRRDAALFDLPSTPKKRGRGQPRKYGKPICLAKRAAHRDGWQSITYFSRGETVTRPYKTFTAMSRMTRSLIRVVIVRYEGSWAAYLCSDPTQDVREILEAVASRWALEEHFHDVKEIWGAGQQQVRNVWSNIGCWHLNQWLYTLVELCSWDRDHASLTDRSDRPWDNASRRPSHADRRRTISREMLQNEFFATVPATTEPDQIPSLLESLLKLCL